ncbi:unnamed protein product [Closterium sp. Yama58-4]|nr:unnamed protein product [Closterium sp. Yama58-4]
MAEQSLSILTCTEMNELETQMVHVDNFARLTSSTSDATPDPVSLTGAIDPNASGVSSFHAIEPQEIHDAMLRQDSTLAAERDPAIAEATVIEHDKMDVDAIPPQTDQDQIFPKEIHEAKETQQAATDQEIHEVADQKDFGMEMSSAKEEVKTERCNDAEASAVTEAIGAVATEATESTEKVAGDAATEAPEAAAIEVAVVVATEAEGEAVTKVETESVDHVERRVEEASVPAGAASEDVKMEDVNDGAHGTNDAADGSKGAADSSKGAADGSNGAADGSNDANKDDSTGDVVAASDKEGDTAKDDAEARSANPAMDADNADTCSSPRQTLQKAHDASVMSPPRDPAVTALGAETNSDTPPPSKPGVGTPSFSVGTPSVAADTPRQQTISPDSQSSLVDPGLVADESAAPFTISQWQQLEQQALIFKYLVSGAAVPPELIDSLYSTADSPRQSLDGPASWATPLKDAEPLRCRRTDGKKWRCSREVQLIACHATNRAALATPFSRFGARVPLVLCTAVTDQKYCERHMHRGRNRPGKSRRISDKATAGSSLSIQAASSEGPMGCVEGTCSAMTDTCTDTPCHKGLVPKFELGSVSKLEIGSVSKLRLNTDDVGSTVTRSPPPPLALPPPAQPVGADQARTPASKTSYVPLSVSPLLPVPVFYNTDQSLPC